MKTLYFIRHGYALHNEMAIEMGETAYQTIRDPPLLKKGINQACVLKKTKWFRRHKPDLVVVSP